MCVLIPGKLLYLFHPRTASISTAKALAKYPHAIRNDCHHATLEKAKQLLPYDGEPVICTIRNPYDLAVSWWYLSKSRLHIAQSSKTPWGAQQASSPPYHHIETKRARGTWKDFPQFCHEYSEAPYTHALTDMPGNNPGLFWAATTCNYLVRYEELDDNLLTLSQRIHLHPQLRIRYEDRTRTVGKRDHSLAWHYKDNNAASTIFSRFGKEITPYGYGLPSD